MSKSKKSTSRSFDVVQVGLDGNYISPILNITAENISDMKKKVEVLSGFKKNSETNPIWEKDYSADNRYFLSCESIDQYYYSIREI